LLRRQAVLLDGPPVGRLRGLDLGNMLLSWGLLDPGAAAVRPAPAEAVRCGESCLLVYLEAGVSQIAEHPAFLFVATVEDPQNPSGKCWRRACPAQFIEQSAVAFRAEVRGRDTAWRAPGLLCLAPLDGLVVRIDGRLWWIGELRH